MCSFPLLFIIYEIFLFKINPEGKVPAYVDADGILVTDSVKIANYLDKKYPEPALYRNETKSRDLELLDQYSKVLRYNNTSFIYHINNILLIFKSK